MKGFIRRLANLFSKGLVRRAGVYKTNILKCAQMLDLYLVFISRLDIRNAQWNMTAE